MVRCSAHSPLATLFVGAALAFTTGCQRHTLGGQTQALVNGEPVTSGDVELELSQMPPQARVGARAQVLQALIDRKLFAQDASARGFERSAQFVALERRWRELMLARRDADFVAARAGGSDQADAAAKAIARQAKSLHAGATILIAPASAAR